MKFQRLLKFMRSPIAVILSLFMLFSVFGCSMEDVEAGLSIAGDIIELAYDEHVTAAVWDISEDSEPIDKDGYFYDKDSVSLYIQTYWKFPTNYITKSEAEALGWEGGSVERYLEGAAIGGDVFGNREGLLPKKSGRVYYECDIDTNGASSRGAERIVYSNDGLIYYTPDHYESFELLYGEE